MQEYSNTVKSADVGLPWEAHLNAKKQFEVRNSTFETNVRACQYIDCKVT